MSCTPTSAGLIFGLSATVRARVRIAGAESAPQVERTLFWRTAGPAPVSMNQKAVRSGDWKLLVDGAVTRLILIDVRADPGARQDWFGRRPDIVQRLRPLLTEWEREVDAEAKAFATTLP